MMRLIIAGVSGAGTYFLGNGFSFLHRFAFPIDGFGISYLMICSVAIGVMAYRSVK